MFRRRLLYALSLTSVWCSLGLALSASSCTNDTVTVENATICTWDATSKARFAQQAMKNHPGTTYQEAYNFLYEKCNEDWRASQQSSRRSNESCGPGGCDHIVTPP